MPRSPQVRYFDSRKTYFTTYKGRQIPLAVGPKDEPTGPTSLAAGTALLSRPTGPSSLPGESLVGGSARYEHEARVFTNEGCFGSKYRVRRSGSIIPGSAPGFPGR